MERAFHQSAETTAHTIINNFPQLESSIDMLFSSLINNSVTMVKIENELDNFAHSWFYNFNTLSQNVSTLLSTLDLSPVGEEKCISSQSKNMSSKLLSRTLFLLRDIQNKIKLILRTDSLDVKTFENVLTSKLLELVTFQEVTFTDKLSSQSVFLTNMKLNVLEKISLIEAKVNALTKLESIFLYSFNVTEGVMREIEANITNAVMDSHLENLVKFSEIREHVNLNFRSVVSLLIKLRQHQMELISQYKSSDRKFEKLTDFFSSLIEEKVSVFVESLRSLIMEKHSSIKEKASEHTESLSSLIKEQEKSMEETLLIFSQRIERIEILILSTLIVCSIILLMMTVCIICVVFNKEN